jgi:hypothetical protein
MCVRASEMLQAISAAEWRGESPEVASVAFAFLQGKFEIQVPDALSRGSECRPSLCEGPRCSRWFGRSIVRSF